MSLVEREGTSTRNGGARAVLQSPGRRSVKQRIDAVAMLFVLGLSAPAFAQAPDAEPEPPAEGPIDEGPLDEADEGPVEAAPAPAAEPTEPAPAEPGAEAGAEAGAGVEGEAGGEIGGEIGGELTTPEVTTT